MKDFLQELNDLIAKVGCDPLNRHDDYLEGRLSGLEAALELFEGTKENPHFLALQAAALTKARAKHAPMTTRHEGYAVILEEVDELWKEVKNGGNDTDPVNKKHLCKELLHIAAMCQRMAEDLGLLEQ